MTPLSLTRQCLQTSQYSYTQCYFSKKEKIKVQERIVTHSVVEGVVIYAHARGRILERRSGLRPSE
jgi:hypothetical protein